MSYTKIQFKRTSGGKTLDDNTVKNIIPAYGEPVFSHSSTKDELVIGDGTTTIENLPRVSMTSSDERVRLNEVTSGTTYYPAMGVGQGPSTREYDTTGFSYEAVTGTTSAQGTSTITLGNSIASGTAGNKKGQLVLYGTNAKSTTIIAGTPSSDRTITLPNATGTLATVGGSIGAATATTPTSGDSSTKVATTAFVNDAIASATSGSTDKKLEIALNTSGTTYYPIIGTGTSAATRQYDTSFQYVGTTGTSNVVGTATVSLGNATASGTAGNEKGQIVLYGTNTHKVTVEAANPTSDITVTLPTSAGTLATESYVTTAISNNTKVVLPTSQPSSPVTGQLYIDNTNHTLKYYNGSAWQSIVGVWG